MNRPAYEAVDHAQQISEGHCAAVFALVLALHESGVLPLSVYRETLHRVWAKMPEEVALGEAGAVIERVLDLLGAPTETGDRSTETTNTPAFPVIAARPVNDDAVAGSAAPRLKAQAAE